MKLAELQRRVQESVLATNASALPLVKHPVEGTSASRLSVYQQAYGLRHAEFLRNDFPSLLAYMGDDKFNGMANLYARMHHSTHPNARWFSTKVPAFMATTLPFSRKPELSELAGLEGALGDAFDAEDAGHVSIAELAACDPQGFAHVALAMHPSARLLTFKTNAASIWSSLKAEERPPSPIMLQMHQDILVWRQSYTSRFRLLGSEETMAFQSAKQGLPFGVICEMIATFGDPDTAGIRAATYLKGWIESELVAALRLADAAGEK